MKRLLPLLLLLALTACGSADSTPAATPEEPSSGFTEETCPDLLVIGVRGQNQSPDANGGLGTEVRLVSTALTRLLQERGDVSVRRESVDYESDPAPNLEAYGRAVAVGARALQDRLMEVETGCDDTQVAVIGFSMGANIVHEALHARSVGAIRLVAMIADPQRNPASTFDVDAFGQPAPRAGSLGAGPDFAELGAHTVSFCATGDDVCNHTPGVSRTATDAVHKHFYEDPAHVAAMAREMGEVLARSGF